MKVGAGTILAVGFCWIMAAFPSTAAATEVGWNPFLNTPFCSTCGAQTPLTLEQADRWAFLPTDFLGDILTGPELFPVEFDAPVDPGGPAAGGGGGSPAPGVGIPGFVDPPSTNSGGGVPGGGGNAGGGNAGGGNAGGGNAGGGNPGGGNPGGGDAGGGNAGGGNAGGGNAGGLDDGVSANTPSGSNDANGGSNGPQNDVTTIDALADTVPEPTTLMLLGAGLSAMAVRRRRRIAERS
jgi:hypothetical protein